MNGNRLYKKGRSSTSAIIMSLICSSIHTLSMGELFVREIYLCPPFHSQTINVWIQSRRECHDICNRNILYFTIISVYYVKIIIKENKLTIWMEEEGEEYNKWQKIRQEYVGVCFCPNIMNEFYGWCMLLSVIYIS